MNHPSKSDQKNGLLYLLVHYLLVSWDCGRIEYWLQALLSASYGIDATSLSNIRRVSQSSYKIQCGVRNNMVTEDQLRINLAVNIHNTIQRSSKTTTIISNSQERKLFAFPTGLWWLLLWTLSGGRSVLNYHTIDLSIIYKGRTRKWCWKMK